MQIVNFEGKMGSGKTLSCTAFAFMEFLGGRKIVANYNLNFIKYMIDNSGGELKTKEDVEKLGYKIPQIFDIEYFIEHLADKEIYESLIIFDEAYLYMDSRGSGGSRMNKLFTWFVNQTRKRDVDLYICTQHKDQLDKRLLRACTLRVLCMMDEKRHIVKNKLINMRSGDKNYLYIYAPDWWELYDTKEVIDVPQGQIYLPSIETPVATITS
jgi:hypothetical protein